MIGISFKYNSGYKSLLRDQYFELEKAFPGLVLYERETPESEGTQYNGVTFTKCDNMDHALPEGTVLVVITALNAQNIQGDVSLEDYTHPESALYFFGDDQSDLTQADIGKSTEYDKVYIPIEENVWSAQAIAIVLYDRQIKNG